MDSNLNFADYGHPVFVGAPGGGDLLGAVPEDFGPALAEGGVPLPDDVGGAGGADVVETLVGRLAALGKWAKHFMTTSYC